MDKRRYGLFTAITMITGVVIGSGIFFKADNVLSYTNGNVLLGIIIFILAAIAIIFGCLAISQLANLTDKPGGVIAYTEEFVGINPSCAFGWFQTFLYLPTLTAVVSWVIGIYLCQLFSIEYSLEITVFIGFISMTILFILNTLSAKLGGYFQNASMIIKTLPLLIIAIAGLILGNPGEVMADSVESYPSASGSTGWLAAFAPIAFSFDGWIVSTSICSEIKNSKRNLPLALTISPLIILLVYVGYFVGISSLIGPEVILEQGDGSTFTAANMLFGDIGAKVILIFIIISVLGTVNGLCLGFIRMPYSLALRNMIAGSSWLKKEEKKLGQMPVNSAIFAYVLSTIWLIIHYFTQKFGMRGDVSEITIGVSYLNYIVLYLTVMRLAKKGTIIGVIKGYVIPILAILGSLVILSGSISHPLFIYYFLICFAILLAGYFYCKVNKEKIR